ncbi:MAG: glycosyltransferase family 4 protein [Acetobacteraceae bacterium]
MPDGLNRGARLLVTTDAVGGVWRYAVDLATGLAERGIEAVLAVLGPAPDAAQRREAARFRLVDTGLPLDWTAEGPADLGRATDALRRLAALTGVAGVHLHAPALAGSGAWPVPVVAVAHSCVATWWRAVRGGALPEDFRWRTQAAAAGLAAAQAIIAPSRAHADALLDVYGPLAIKVVHNGGVAVAGPGGARDRAVLTAGRLWDTGKNAAALDRVASDLGAPIRAAGPIQGPNGAAIALPHLDLLGTLDPAGMARAYAGASVFASLALYEPFGLAVLEAAQAGMRLVLSDIPSFRELWDGAASFVRDEADLLPALRAALQQQGDGGAQVRAAQYSRDAMVAGTLAVHRMAGALV